MLRKPFFFTTISLFWNIYFVTRYYFWFLGHKQGSHLRSALRVVWRHGQITGPNRYRFSKDHVELSFSHCSVCICKSWSFQWTCARCHTNGLQTRWVRQLYIPKSRLQGYLSSQALSWCTHLENIGLLQWGPPAGEWLILNNSCMPRTIHTV